MNAFESSIPRTGEPLVRAYIDAWNQGNISAILEHHTDDTVYTFHDGSAQYQGRAAVGAAFAVQLKRFKRLTIELETLHLGESHAVFESVVTAVPTGGGEPVVFDMLDLLVYRGGRIARKDTYVDPTLFNRPSGGR